MMSGLSQRRPVWQPSNYARLLGYIKPVLKQITFGRTLIAAFFLPLVLYVFKEVNRDVLIVDPFTVPKSLEETGLSSVVMANRIGGALRHIEAAAQTQMKKDNLTSSVDEGSIPDVEIPGTKLGLKALVDTTRAVLEIYPKHVSGDIVTVQAISTDDAPIARPRVMVTVYVTQGRSRSSGSSFTASADSVEALAQSTAEVILENVNPYVLAVHRCSHNEIEKAVELIERIARDPSSDPNHVEAAFNLWGSVLDDQRRYDDAIAKYKKANILDPKDAFVYNNWGVALYNQRKYDEAIVKYQKTISLDHGYAPAYSNWGLALYHQRKYGDAIAKYHKAIDLDPKNASVYDNWGLVLTAQGKYSDAIANYRQAIDIDPKDTAAYNRWGLALYEQRNYRDAVVKYQKATEIDPKFAEAYNNWGNALEAQGKHAEAKIKFEKAHALGQ